jgi:peptide/nickel transport system permease protein
MMRLKPILRYKSAVIGISVLLFLVGVSVYTVVTLPFEKAAQLWRAGELTWLDTPRNAAPAWFNLFTSKKLPETIIRDTRNPGPETVKVVVPAGQNIKILRAELSFNYDYDDFPSEINLFFTSSYNTSQPRLTISWLKPDGAKIGIKELSVGREDKLFISADTEVVKKLNERVESILKEKPASELSATAALFAVEDASMLNPETIRVQKGRYTLLVEGFMFEPDADVDVKLVVYGKVYGWAGTDHLRRDIGIALLWGTPIALLFGVSAAVSIALIQMTIGAVSAWFRGVVDTAMQRVVEIFLVLPFLPVLINGLDALQGQHLGNPPHSHRPKLLRTRCKKLPRPLPTAAGITLHRGSPLLRRRKPPNTSPTPNTESLADNDPLRRPLRG